MYIAIYVEMKLMIITDISNKTCHSYLNKKLIMTFFIIFMNLLGCANNEEAPEDAFINDIVNAYDSAKSQITAGNYRRAIEIFEAIQSRFPFSDLSNQIQLELIHAYYKMQSQEQTIDAADAFMRENPTHPRIDYALYIKALAYFEKEPDFLEKSFRKDMNKRPPKDTIESYSFLKQLVERYPASEYAADAEQRMIFIKNRLAAYENIVADYYLRMGAYVAAINRAKSSLEEYNGSIYNQGSLDILIQAYDKLGMTELSEDARRVRETNFSNEGMLAQQTLGNDSSLLSKPKNFLQTLFPPTDDRRVRETNSPNQETPIQNTSENDSSLLSKPKNFLKVLFPPPVAN